MRFGFYPRLAADGIRKNRRMYLPYILTCIGMVMMTYIMGFLKTSETVVLLRGGKTIQAFMDIGLKVISFFAAIFLFYTNSFLTRRRKKEFGLYHVLGMGKRNLSGILVWESVFVAVISLVCGMGGGIALSKLAELGLVNIMEGEITYTLSVSADSIILTGVLFAGIFLLLLVNSLRQVWFSSAVSLLKSENTGEKPPKANWLLGLLGVIILAAAYYIALTIKDPISAISAFLLAVLMVIAATYFIMIAGSVLFCRILQKRKKYYYKPNHFVSVSSMAYRMKRNGAGLASICILATMVLVMISSSSALFFGGEDVIRNRYPREIDTCFSMYENKTVTKEDQAAFENVIDGVLKEHGTAPEQVIKYHSISTAGVLQGGEVFFDQAAFGGFGINEFSDVHMIYLVSIEDYNAMMGTDISLAEDEALVYAPRKTFDSDTFRFTGLKQYRVREILKECFLNSEIEINIVPSLMVILPDAEEAAEGLVNSAGSSLVRREWYYCFDTSLNPDGSIALYHDLEESLTNWKLNGHDTFSVIVESREYERNAFYSLYGGLFYLGIMLSIVFIFAAVLIIYYKQISEGYEDQARFEIMQKVGMTGKDIRRSINSQLLTVFFLPLIGAGLHLAFAFPIIEKLLLLFNLNDHNLFVCTTIGSFLVFALFYGIVYRITSNAYYQIVS